MAITDNGAGSNSGGGALSPDQVRAIAYQAGFRGSGLDTAVKVAGAESARIPTNRYAPGPQEDSRGLWQINIAPSANPGYASQNLYDPLTNAKIAFAMSHGGTSWGPWTTYTSGRYLSQPAGTGAGGGAPAAMTGIAQQKAGAPSTPSSAGSPGSPGGIDYNAAGIAALMAAANKPISAKGTFKPDNVLGSLMNAAASGKYTTPATGSSTPSAGQAATPVGKGGGDVNPLHGWNLGRTDMGVDASANVGAPIRAINDSKVIGYSPNWYAGQPYMLMQLTAGPNAGKFWYVSEQINNMAPVGSTVARGQAVAHFAPSGTGIEIGWGSPTPSRTLAQQQGNTGDSSHGNAPAGVDFAHLLAALKGT